MVRPIETSEAGGKSSGTLSEMFNRVADVAGHMWENVKNDLAVVASAVVMDTVNKLTETRNAPDGTAKLLQQRAAAPPFGLKP